MTNPIGTFYVQPLLGSLSMRITPRMPAEQRRIAFLALLHELRCARVHAGAVPTTFHENCVRDVERRIRECVALFPEYKVLARVAGRADRV
jgi:hypothetical protein